MGVGSISTAVVCALGAASDVIRLSWENQHRPAVKVLAAERLARRRIVIPALLCSPLWLSV